MPPAEKPKRRSRVPVTRAGRLLRLGLTAGELAAGGLIEGARRLGGRQGERAASALLSAANASRLAKRLAHMRGAAMKLGQLLSMESEQVLPREFADALAILRDSADVMPVSQLNRILGREYGRGWQGRFELFDPEPVAAASIGQVHYARTTDGRDLALKVQYPGVAKSISSDVDNLATLLRMARVLPMEMDVTGIVAETKRQLAEEADYLQEAAALERYRGLTADEPGVRVPAVHDDFTTRRILAMDWLEGEPLEGLAGPRAVPPLADEVGGLLYRLLFRELFEFRFMQTDPNFANYLWEPDAHRLQLLDFGATMSFPRAFVERYRRICIAMMEHDRETVARIALEIGYLHPEDEPGHAGEVLDLLFLVCEPLVHEGVYDFGRSDLMLRARDAGFDLVFRSGRFRAPPPETIFLHRKLVGTFLLCARLGARMDVRKLIAPFVGPASSNSRNRRDPE